MCIKNVRRRHNWTNQSTDLIAQHLNAVLDVHLSCSFNLSSSWFCNIILQNRLDFDFNPPPKAK